MLEKFTSVASREFFQFGQWAYISGSGVDRHLNASSLGSQDFRFLRQKFLIATKLSDVLIRKSKRETITFNAEHIKGKVLAIIESPTCDINPEILIISEIMREQEEKPTLDDLIFYVDGREPLAMNVLSKIETLLERSVSDFSVTNIQTLLEDKLGQEMVTYDFSKLLAEEELVSAASGCVEEEAEEEPLTKKCRL